jgi:hypothetical protein
MDKEAAIQDGAHALRCVRQFLQVFPDAEHTIVPAKRQVGDDEWSLVSEWISRARLYDRYVWWLVLAIEVSTSDTVAPLEEPQVFVVEVESIAKSRDEAGAPKWQFGFGQIDESDWQEMVAAGTALDFREFGLEVDQPVERFETFWNDTRPHHIPPADDAIALKAPLRFLS